MRNIIGVNMHQTASTPPRDKTIGDVLDIKLLAFSNFKNKIFQFNDIFQEDVLMLLRFRNKNDINPFFFEKLSIHVT